MKFDLTNIVIIALVAIAIILPASLYAYDYYYGVDPIMLADYCEANGFMEVFNCSDGSFMAIKEDYIQGFRIVKTDGSYIDCPFTLPGYQEGECKEYTTQQICANSVNLCEVDNSCITDLDCTGKCVDWACY